MQVRNIAVGLVAVSLLAGCSIFERKQVDYKAGATQAPALEVPPDLTVPETDQRYTIPGTDGEKVASYSEYVRKAPEQPCVAPASAPAAANPESPAARLQDRNGVKSILLGEPFDRSWRKIGLALENARIATTDKDRSKGIYFIAAAPDKDKQKQPDLQVLIRESSEGSEVSIVDADGKSNAETARLVETIYQNLEK